MSLSSRNRKFLLGLGVGLVVASLLAVLRGSNGMRGMELGTLDARFRAFHDPARADTSIVIIDADNLSLGLMRHTLGRWPWRREVWDRVVSFASAGGARAIAFDFAFPEPDLDHPADDSAFAQGAQAAGTVVQTLSLQRVVGGTDSLDRAGDPADVSLLPRFAWPGVAAADTFQASEHPYAQLLAASRGIGVINFTPDPVDGTLRRVPLFSIFRGHLYPSLGLAAAWVADSARFGPASAAPRATMLGALRVPTDSGALLVNWRGPYRTPGAAHPETYRIYPAAQIINSYAQLRAGQTPEVPLENFRGKIVFIASSASGTFEARANPFGPSDPGVLIHATLADNLLRSDFLRRAPTTVNLFALFGAALLAGVLVAVIPSAGISAAAGAVLLLLQGGVAALLFARSGIWLDAAAPMIAVVLTFTGGMSLNYVTEGRRKRQIREMFSKYVAPEYVARLAENPRAINLGGERAELSILFSDIRGFTTISEKMEPHQVIEFLNEYLTSMAAIVKQSGGTLDKFIGDAVMAFWGEPVKHADHADRAADCALAMRDATAELARRWVAQGKPDIRIGIGINTAEVVVGNIGSLEHKLDYTVIGDGVNLASRLEGLNKDFGTTIIISDHARVKLGDRFDVRPLGDVKVKGKEHPLPIFELLGRRTVVTLLMLVALAGTARAQQSQWSDAVYVPGRWVGGHIATAPAESLALLARVDYFSKPPKWRAEIRRSANGQSFADQPDVLIGEARSVVVLTQIGSTPLDQHALGRDSLARAVAAAFDATGRRGGAASGRIVQRDARSAIARVIYRRAVRGAFNEALLNPGRATASRNLLASNISRVGDQRNAGVVATAGARGVDRVNTPKGSVPVTPDSSAIKRMETFAVGSLALEEFLRGGKLGAYRDSTP